MNVVTLRDFTPIPRYDDKPWTHVTIEEGPTEDGPWTALGDIDLLPVDTDPKYPASRDFTIENATLADGWYVVTFKDEDGDQQLPIEPVHYIPDEAEPYRPLVSDVAELLRARTKDKYGNEVGNFTADTRPNQEQVQELIDQATDDIVADLDTDIPASAYRYVKRLITIRAAMEVELSYWPEQTNTDRSAYRNLKELFDEQLIRVTNAVERETLEEEFGDMPAASVSYVFNRPINWDWVVW